MGIYRQNRIVRWIGDVILIPLGTFKPMDGRHVCPGTSTWVFDMWSGQFLSVSPTLKLKNNFGHNYRLRKQKETVTENKF